MSHLHHKVSALIDGELSPNARTRALAHARGCAECRQEIAETLEVKRRVNRLAPVEVSADLLDVVGSITLPADPVVPSARLPLLRRVFAGVGSLSAVVIALAYVVGAPQASEAKTVSPPVEEFAAEFADGTGQLPLSDPAVGVLDADRVSSDVTSPVTVAPRIRRSTGTTPSAVSTLALGSPMTLQASGDNPRAVAQLGRALEAPVKVGYRGVLVIQSYRSGGVDSSRVAVQHVPGQGTEFDVLSDGGRVRAASFVAEPDGSDRHLEGASLDMLGDAYDLGLEPRERIDGRMATVVTASQHGQVIARFWIDVESGILLRRDLYTDGRLVRQTAFTSFEQTPHGFMPHLSQEVTAPPTTPLSMDVAPALNDKGWACPERLNEHFQLAFLNQIDAAGGVMRAEYTDGLSRISVFEERGSLDTSSLDSFRTATFGGHLVYLKPGLPMVVVWESDGTVFTAVTDAPQQMAAHLISQLPHVEEQPTPGVTSRVGHGLSRMVSAVAP